MPQSKNQKRAKILEKFEKEFSELKLKYEQDLSLHQSQGNKWYLQKPVRYFYVESQINNLKRNMEN